MALAALIVIAFLGIANGASPNLCLLPEVSSFGCAPSSQCGSASTTMDNILGCAQSCASGRTNDTGVIKFQACGATCQCVTDFPFGVESQGKALTNDSLPFTCPSPMQAQILSLESFCPTIWNATQCSSFPSCTFVKGCCGSRSKQPAAQSPQVPKVYTEMIQWCIIAVLIMCVLEAFLYGCIRYRRAQRRTEDTTDEIREQQVQFLHRSAEDAKKLATNLVETFPSPLFLPSDACTICLEPFAGRSCVELPCRHIMHAHCLADLLEHELQRSDDAACPSCRATLLVDTALPALM